MRVHDAPVCGGQFGRRVRAELISASRSLWAAGKIVFPTTILTTIGGGPLVVTIVQNWTHYDVLTTFGRHRTSCR